MTFVSTFADDINESNGSGSNLSTPVLLLAGICTLIATFVSLGSIHLHLKNYRKPLLQRMVVRIIVMVPLYAISSLISIFSLSAAFFIDAIRDIYEAFVIYCFFDLLLQYLGGERQFLISMQGRQPKPPVFPVNLWKREIDISDPHTFLFIKRGIFQYAQVKPVLAIATLILKATGKFNDGDLKANSGYLYVSIVYNTSITLSLYCLAVFWMCINDDVKPFRPVPKFLCIKGILFFSFWQNLLISILVATNVLTHLGPYTDPEKISTSLTDTLICIEMPFFAIAHQYAFSYRDFLAPTSPSSSLFTYVARMPMYYAFRDAFGSLDIIMDTKATFSREHGMDYRAFETSDVDNIHVGEGRERRIRAGLRYVKGGRGKYWLGQEGAGLLGSPARADEDDHEGESNGGPYAFPYDHPNVVFAEDDELYSQSRKYLFGDYNYPTIDVSTESARIKMWDEEERVLRDERGAWFSDIRGAKGRAYLGERRREGFGWQGYGAVGTGGGGSGSGLNAAVPVIQEEDGRLVDHEDLKIPVPPPSDEQHHRASSSTDVRLTWTHYQPQQPRRTPGGSKGSSISSGSVTKGKKRSVSPPSPSAHQASAGRPRSRKISVPKVQEDAVDLVVEDQPQPGSSSLVKVEFEFPSSSGDDEQRRLDSSSAAPIHSPPPHQDLPHQSTPMTLPSRIEDGWRTNSMLGSSRTPAQPPPPHRSSTNPWDNPWA